MAFGAETHEKGPHERRVFLMLIVRLVIVRVVRVIFLSF